MSKRGVVLTLFLAVINAYIAFCILRRWPQAAGMWGIAPLFFLLQLLAPMGMRNFLPHLRLAAPRWAMAVNWVSYSALGLMTILMMYCFVADIVQFILFVFSPEDIDVPVLVALGAATSLTVLAGLRHVIGGPQLKRVDVPLDNLPAALDGFTIAQVSDLHLGETLGAGYARRVVEKVNSAKPDLIALTGDFMDGTARNLAPDVAPLKGLHAPRGVFYITGNHEYYWGALDWIETFRRLGAQPLINEHVVIGHNGAAFVLAGVTDYVMGRMIPGHASNPHKAAAQAPEGLVKILLAHQPGSRVEAEKAGFALQLSGHTHGGQYFPFTQMIRFFHRYYKGLNRYKGMWLYINTGTGYWGPPFKTTPPEVTLLTLRMMKSAAAPSTRKPAVTG